MIIKKVREINGKLYNYIYSDTGAVLRCGRLQYKDALDPIYVDRTYFEESAIEPNETVETDMNETNISNDNELTDVDKLKLNESDD